MTVDRSNHLIHKCDTCGANGAPVLFANGCPHCAICPPPQADPLSELREALTDAIEQLEGWVSWKCPAKHKAEHEANIERLRAALASQPPAPEAPDPAFALENCRLYAARHRKEEWAEVILRFCRAGGATGSPLRAAPEAQREPTKALIAGLMEDADSYAQEAAESRSRLAASMERQCLLENLTAALSSEAPVPLTLEYIEQHIGSDEGDRDAVLALVREVEKAHGIK